VAGLDRFQRQFLDAFFEREPGFFLTGGGALAEFHLHHRTTNDLDLFSVDDNLDLGVAAVHDTARSLGAAVESLRTAPTFRRFLVSRGNESVVVDLVRDLAPQVVEEKLVIDGIRVDVPAEIMANKLCTVLSRGELRDLVDVRALEASGLRVEDHIEAAARKDAGLTPAQLAWVLSELEIADDASIPGGVEPEELREYVAGLIERLTAMAFPGP